MILPRDGPFRELVCVEFSLTEVDATSLCSVDQSRGLVHEALLRREMMTGALTTVLPQSASFSKTDSMKNSIVIANLLAWLVSSAALGTAAEQAQKTSVLIRGMHCAACANKVSKKLKAVANVESAEVNAEKGIAVIIATEGKELSSKALWEAVEKTGYKPTELKGPQGTFNSKPKK